MNEKYTDVKYLNWDDTDERTSIKNGQCTLVQVCNHYTLITSSIISNFLSLVLIYPLNLLPLATLHTSYIIMIVLYLLLSIITMWFIEAKLLLLFRRRNGPYIKTPSLVFTHSPPLNLKIDWTKVGYQYLSDWYSTPRLSKKYEHNDHFQHLSMYMFCE